MIIGHELRLELLTKLGCTKIYILITLLIIVGISSTGSSTPKESAH
jgi:hypothetical protein